MVAAVKTLLLILVMLTASAHADMCFRSTEPAMIEGMPGRTHVSFLWSDQGSAMDEIRFDGERMRAGSDLRCTESPPISCRLSDDAGAFRLIFEGNKVRVISRGFRVSFQPGVIHVRLKNSPQTIVHELVQLSEGQCQALFPVRRKIEVIPSPENSTPIFPNPGSEIISR